MRWWAIIGSLAMVWCFAMLGGSAWAQQSTPGQSSEFGIRAPAPPLPTPQFGVQPTWPPAETGTRQQEFYPGVKIRSLHEPAFVEPFVADVPVGQTSAVRIGLSGWTAPALPYDTPDSTGGVAFGLTIQWGRPPVAPAKPPEPETGQR